MSCQHLRRLAVALAVVSIFAGVGWGDSPESAVPESAFNRDPWPAAKQGLVKVFILAGQSNMQGHAALRTLEYLIYNIGSERGYHYLGSARIYTKMGKAFAEGMIELLDK